MRQFTIAERLIAGVLLPLAAIAMRKGSPPRHCRVAGVKLPV